MLKTCTCYSIFIYLFLTKKKTSLWFYAGHVKDNSIMTDPFFPDSKEQRETQNVAFEVEFPPWTDLVPRVSSVCWVDEDRDDLGFGQERRRPLSSHLGVKVVGTLFKVVV